MDVLRSASKRQELPEAYHLNAPRGVTPRNT